MRRAWALLVFLGLAGLAQGIPQVQEVGEREVGELLARTREVISLGLPPESLREALEGKRLTLVLGSEAPPGWAKGRVVRLGGGRMGGVILLADGRYFIGRKERGRWAVVDSPHLVAVLLGYFAPALGR